MENNANNGNVSPLFGSALIAAMRDASDDAIANALSALHADILARYTESAAKHLPQTIVWGKAARAIEANDHEFQIAARAIVATGCNPRVLTSSLRDNAEFNEKALEKLLRLSRAFLTMRPLPLPAMGATSPENTLRGTAIALLAGNGERSRLSHALNDYMRNVAGKANYGSGATQSSSSCRALAAFGIIALTRAGDYRVLNRALLAQIAHGVSGDTTPPPADDFEGETIEGECMGAEYASPAQIAAIAAPVTLASESWESEGEGETLQIAYDPAVYGDETPAPAPAKAKRTRKAKVSA